MWFLIIEFVILISWLGVKFTLSIFCNGSSQGSYFAHYLYHSYFQFPVVFILMLLVLTMFIIHYKIKAYKTRRSFKAWIAMNGFRIAGIVIIICLCLMSISMGYQIQTDYNHYKSNKLSPDIIKVTSYNLSDGARISKSVLPYKIYTDKEDETYYLYRKTKLSTQATYSIKYFINHSNEKILLGISLIIS